MKKNTSLKKFARAINVKLHLITCSISYMPHVFYLKRFYNVYGNSASAAEDIKLQYKISLATLTLMGLLYECHQTYYKQKADCTTELDDKLVQLEVLQKYGCLNMKHSSPQLENLHLLLNKSSYSRHEYFFNFLGSMRLQTGIELSLVLLIDFLFVEVSKTHEYLTPSILLGLTLAVSVIGALHELKNSLDIQVDLMNRVRAITHFINTFEPMDVSIDIVDITANGNSNAKNFPHPNKDYPVGSPSQIGLIQLKTSHATVSSPDNDEKQQAVLSPRTSNALQFFAKVSEPNGCLTDVHDTLRCI
jgi:hypothetical protein